MKFKFQAVFAINEDNELVLVGTTRLTPGNLYLFLTSKVDKMNENTDAKCVNFIYQPIKENENETSKKK